ncbi:tyrosine-type recombinase/integrase [Priestia koreensis]|uniref:tyrosine-type recombinase/integrase n=1 Tax=Priestia koreensis TaxID=284581 RepID=UPI003D030B70
MKFVEPIRDRKKIDVMKKLLASHPRDQLLFIMGINSALRVSDLLELTFGDVIDEAGECLEHIRLKETKTGKYNKIAIPRGVKKAIRQYSTLIYQGDLSQYLFQSRKGDNQPINRKTAWAIIQQAAKEAGIRDNIGAHSLRKTWAYHSYKAGTDILIIQDMLNHSSAAITLRYIGITQDEKDRAILSLDL